MHSFRSTRSTLWGELLEWGQLFLEEILWRGGNYPRGQLSGGNHPEGNYPGGNCPRTIFRIGGVEIDQVDFSLHCDSKFFKKNISLKYFVDLDENN